VRAFRVLSRTLRPKTLWQGPSEPLPESGGRVNLMLAHPVHAGGVLASGAMTLAASWLTAVLVLGLLAMVSFALIIIRYHAYSAYQSGLATAISTGQRILPRATFSRFIAEYAPNLTLPGVPWTTPSADTQRLMVMTMWVVGSALVMPLAFLLLGQTMTKHRVRRRHLWRIGAYALTPLPLIGLAFSLVSWTAMMLDWVRIWLTNARAAAEVNVAAYAWAHPESGWGWLKVISDRALYAAQFWVMREGSAIVTLLALGFVWLFWFRASSRYLRLPSAALDTFLLLVVSVLATPAIAYVAAMGVRAFTG
jgi:hypothetical protein